MRELVQVLLRDLWRSVRHNSVVVEVFVRVDDGETYASMTEMLQSEVPTFGFGSPAVFDSVPYLQGTIRLSDMPRLKKVTSIIKVSGTSTFNDRWCTAAAWMP